MIYQRGKWKTWWYRFRIAGRIVHESTRTQSKTLAREAERRRRRELVECYNRIEKRTLPPTFERASQDWQASRQGRLAEATLRIGRESLKHLLPVFGSNLLCDISAEDIQAYQSKRRREGAAQGRTVNIEVGVLRAILTAHKLWDTLSGDVHMLAERKDAGKALTHDEERRLLEATGGIDSACHTATLLALNTAMRHDEIRRLQWRQIDWQGRTVAVGKSKTAAGTGRVIPLNMAALDALVKWAGRFPQAQPEHYIFPWCESRHIDPTGPTKGWRTAWRNALKRAGMKCRFHDLRVTCITKLAEGQASDMTIMAIAGHVSRRMLEHYSRIRMDAKRRAVDALNKPLEPAILDAGVNQNSNQIEAGESERVAKLLN